MIVSNTNGSIFDTRAYFAGKDFTTDWTSRNYELWADILSRRREQELSILEVGSWEGRSALFFLNYLPRSKIVCIDNFLGGDSLRGMSKWRRRRYLRAVEGRFDRNLAQFATRVEKIKEDSFVALAQLGIKQRRFDLAYIDGSHLALDVYRDGLLTWPLVVAGGIAIFDDYRRRQGIESERTGVGIDAFLLAVRSQYVELFRGHQIIIRKSMVSSAGGPLVTA